MSASTPVAVDTIEGVTFRRTEAVACPLCKTERSSREIRVQFGMMAMVAECPPCRLAFQTPRPSPEATLAYMNWRWGSADQYVANREAQLKRGAEQLEFVRRYVAEPASLLDFGAGSGSFVYTAQRAGWQVTGVERSPVARRKALEVYGVDLLEVAPDREFDVITLWDVIEHLRSPEELLRQLRKHLAPGGLIFIETGNWECWLRTVNKEKWSVYLFDHHFYFSPASLARTLQNAGYGSFELLDANRVAPPGLGGIARMPRYASQCWMAYLAAKLRWRGHGDIATLIATARRPKA